MVEVVGLRVRILYVQTESDEAPNLPFDNGYYHFMCCSKLPSSLQSRR